MLITLLIAAAALVVYYVSTVMPRKSTATSTTTAANIAAHDAARNRAWLDVMTRNGQITYNPETHTYEEVNGFGTITPPYGNGSTYAPTYA